MNWSWIPQLHYDLIGRIVPGVAIIGASVLVAAGPEEGVRLLSNASGSYFGFGPIVLGILIAYLLGLILSEVWQRTMGAVLKGHEKRIESSCYEACLADHGRLCGLSGRQVTVRLDDLPPNHVMRTHLRHVVAPDVTRLMKLRAERRLCQVLILGFLGLAIANLWPLIGEYGAPRLALELAFLFAAAVLWFRSERLLWHFITGICITWLVQLSSGALPFADARQGVSNG